MSRLPPDTIKSPKRITIINGEGKNLFDWRDEGIIDLHRDEFWGYWEYQVIATGEIVSFQRWLTPKDRSDWYLAALEKQKEKLEMNKDQELTISVGVMNA